MTQPVRRWGDDLSRSARDFYEIVWPVMGPILDKQDNNRERSELRLVEGETKEDMAVMLDVMAGIDAWQMVYSRGVRGIGSRVQWIAPGYDGYDTFTIRYQRDSGVETEFAKRMRAIDQIDKGYIYPHWTIQAYISDDSNRRLESAAVISTRRLYEELRKAGVDGVAHVPPYVPHARFGLQRTDNASFLVVSWDWLGMQGVQLAQYHRPKARPKELTPWWLKD